MSGERAVLNAVISSVDMRLEREMFLCGNVYLKRADGFSQGFGGYVLGGVAGCKAGNHHSQPNLAAMFLVGVMQAADVTDYAKAVGKAIRIEVEPGFNGKITGIGHIIKDDLWFRPEELFAESRIKPDGQWSP